MSLIKSISGIRGTIGGVAGDGLNPLDIVKFTAAYATFIARTTKLPVRRIVVGRDARVSGEMVAHCVVGTLVGMGFDVVDLGLATTPTTELAVVWEEACGGIILILNAEEGNEVLRIAEAEDFVFADIENLGHIKVDNTSIKRHIDSVLSLDLVDVEAIKNARFSVAVDCVNSVGGIAIPALLEALGVQKITRLNCQPDGLFPHNPEPLPQHLTEISDLMKTGVADVGFVVDPDVDRLAIICENGDMFGEEYTLVAVADYVLRHTPGNTVSNLSSSRALRDVTLALGGQYRAAAVGEVNVVAKMKETAAVIGGEGNGGVIYPASHYGRDALVGIALFLTHLAKEKKTVSQLRATYPSYAMTKQRIDLTPAIDVDALLCAVKGKYSCYEVTDIDGVKIDFPDGWVHLRKSNTEPIIRVYAEAATTEQAEEKADAVMAVINDMIK